MIKLISFGYRHGDPPEADVTIDLRRIMDDPADHSDLVELTGLNRAVQRSVMRTRNALGIVELLAGVLPGNCGISSVAVGCSGGRHRSVVIVEEFVDVYGGFIDVEVLHRDIAKPILPRKEA